MELLLLFAIAYAGARGVEAILADTRARYNDRVAERTVRKIAKEGGRGTGEPVDPTAPGGTFSATAAAPRSASIGTKAAAGLATGVEMGATCWKSFYDGYREAWPTAREQARQRMVVRAEEKRAKRAAKDAEARAAAAEKKAADAEAVATAAQAEPTAKEPADKPTTPEPPTAVSPKPDPAPAPAAKPALVLIKAPKPAAEYPATGGTVTIPEVRTLDGLINALGIVKGTSLMRAEEAAAIAAGDAELSAHLDRFEAALADLDVDPRTLAEITALRERIAAQSEAARTYEAAAQNAADLAGGAADAAHKAHGGIAEAVQSSPIPQAAEAGYYNR